MPTWSRLRQSKYSVNLWDLDSHSVAELRKRPTAPRDDRIFTRQSRPLAPVVALMIAGVTLRVVMSRKAN